MQVDIFQCHYALYDRESGSVVEGLHYAQMRALLITIPQDSYPNWLIWQEGEMEWAELKDVFGSYLQSEHPAPPALPNAAQGLILSRMTLVEEAPEEEIDQRLAKRFAHDVKVWIDFNGTITNNEVIDISITGARLKQPIDVPEGELFWLILRVEPNPIQLMARKVKMGVGEKEPRVLILSHKNTDLLREFLLRPQVTTN